MFTSKQLVFIGLIGAWLSINAASACAQLEPLLDPKQTTPAPRGMLAPLTSAPTKPQPAMLRPLPPAQPQINQTRSTNSPWSFETGQRFVAPRPAPFALTADDMATDVLTEQQFRAYLATITPGRNQVVSATTPPDRFAPAVHIAPPAQRLPGPPANLEQQPTMPEGTIALVAFQEPDKQDQEKEDDKTTDQTKHDPEKKDDSKPDAPADDANVMTVKKLESLIESEKKLLNENDSLDEMVKADRLEELNASSANVQKAKASKDLIAAHSAEIEALTPERLEAQKKELEQDIKPDTHDAAATPDELQAQLLTKRQKLEDQNTKLSLKQLEIEKRDNRMPKLPGIRAAAVDRAKKVKRAIAELTDQPDSDAKRIKKIALDAKDLEAQLELEALSLEVQMQEKKGDLLEIERDLIAREIKTLELEITAWDTAYNNARTREIEMQKAAAREALNEALAADPVLETLAKRNRELARQRETLTTKIKNTKAQADTAVGEKQEIEKTLTTFRKKIEAKLTSATGVLLVEYRQRLKQPAEDQAKILEINSELRATRKSKFDLEEEKQKLASASSVFEELIERRLTENLPRSQFADMNERFERRTGYALSEIDIKEMTDDELELLDEIFESVTEKQLSASRLKELTTELVSDQEKYLDSLLKDYEDYQSSLSNEHDNRLALIDTIYETRTFIDENALWVRSAEPIGLADLKKSTAAVSSFFAPGRWAGLAQLVGGRLMSRPYESAFCVCLMMGLFLVSRRLTVKHD